MNLSLSPFPRLFMKTLLLLLGVFGLLAGATAAETLYTCGMHPQIVRKEPGECPICGMDLEPVRNNAATPGTATASHAASAIHVDAGTLQRMNLKTASITTGPVRRELRLLGTVAFNEEGQRDITLKYEGWLEKVHVNTTWASVKAGDPLFDVYSPELYNAGLNYVVALKAEGAAGGPLTRTALARLQLFDVSTEDIEAIARTGSAPRVATYRAPVEGVVIEKMGAPGQMMKPGERIYRLADLSTVWVLAQVHESDLPLVSAGQSVEVSVSHGSSRHFDGVISMILPQLEEQTRTATARILLTNTDGSLRPGAYTEVHLATQLSDKAVLVPDVAVLRSGERNTVFIAKDGGTFEPREVKLGNRSEGNFYEVLGGLEAGERVVLSGQFLLDSESQLREAIQKMLKSEEAAPAAK